MKLRITYTFDITDMPSAGTVFIGNPHEGYIGKGDNLQQAMDQVQEFFQQASGDDFTFDIVDIHPMDDAALLNREVALIANVNRGKGDNESTEVRTEAQQRL
jgi:hypothetical protein